MSKSERAFDRRRFIKTSFCACISSWLALSLGCRGKGNIEEDKTIQEKQGIEAMETMIAKCGLVCTGCEAYIATQNNDYAARVQVAEKWTKLYGAEVTPEEVICDGCQADTGRLSSYADGICQIRKCALEKEVPNCAHCEDYACENLTAFFDMAPVAKTKLEEIRKSL